MLESYTNRLIQLLRCFKKRRYGYLDRDLCYIPSGNESLVIVLSPDFYRITIASLPVKTVKEALRYAASYFDESDEESFFSVYKIKEEEYLFCAFFPDIVRSKIEDLHVNLDSVDRFIFAQEVFTENDLPINLEGGSVLALNDGVVMRVKSEYVSEKPTLQIEEFLKNLSSCNVGFKTDLQTRGIVTKKTVMVTAVLLGIVFFNLLFQGLYFRHEAEKIVDEQEQLVEAKKLPSTQLELEALTSSWEKKEKEQIEMRKTIAAFSTLSLENNNTTLPKPQSLPVLQTNTLVLIPGTKPSERNILLLPNDSNSSSKITANEYVSSLVYENGAVNFEITTPSQERAEKIRDDVAKVLKTNTVSVKRNIVEGSVK